MTKEVTSTSFVSLSGVLARKFKVAIGTLAEVSGGMSRLRFVTQPTLSASINESRRRACNVANVTDLLTREWSKQTQEQVGWYVYALIDPRNSAVFYIGKGKGNRAFQHANEARNSSDVNSQKFQIIRDIQDKTGANPRVVILRHRLASESEAFQIEAALLDFARLNIDREVVQSEGVELANSVRGHHSNAVGLMSAADIEAIYAATPLALSEFPHSAIAFRIAKRWSPAMSTQDVYEVTRGWWRIGSRRQRARLALAVSDGIIRGIFEIQGDSWRPRVAGDRGFTPNSPSRWGFEGIDASGSYPDILHRDISSWFKAGNQTPFLYVNC